jgi:hypothetical protein
MLNRIIAVVLFFLNGLLAQAQNHGVKYRVILVGDAGEMNNLQMQDLKQAAKMVIPGKTTALFLGDNVYPRGMGLPGTSSEEEGRLILRSQFEPMRNAGAAVYFVPGNHDWDRSGINGLAKIKAQDDFLKEQNDPLLKLLPQNGCPDPVAIKLNDKLTIIAYDSEWWLFPYNKQNSDCECQTNDEMLAKLKDLFDENHDKIILLASHHPFQTYGSHGGYFTWKNHIFPLRALNQNLFIPLPVIGSLYPILRTNLLSPEDVKHPKYKDLIKSVNNIFGKEPNVTYVAGHEHGLQLIKSEQLQVVSGSGSKSNPNKMGKYSLFNSEKQGYVVADQLENNDMRFEYYVYSDTGVVKLYSYTKPYTNINLKPVAVVKPIVSDSIVVSINSKLDSVGKFHRSLFGENYRKEYSTPVKIPVIKLSSIKGGLTPTKLGGGNQSRSLRLVDKDGKEWALRSVIKYPEVLLPEQLRQTFARDILRDNTSAQHPFSSLVVPVLADAVNVPHSNPIIGYVSPDVNLGSFASIFENTVCLLEEREPLGDSDNTLKMLRKLAGDNDNTVNAQNYLKAKCLDVFLGDWDRHDDQWRFKVTKGDKGNNYLAVPRDRDMVFYSTDGFLQRYAQSSWLLPMMQGYERNLKNINWFLWEGREMNSKIFNEMDEQQWNKIVQEFCSALTDEILETSLKRLPPVINNMRHDKILAQMKERRETLPKMMADYYRFFNKIVDVELTDKNELVTIKDTEDKGLKITVRKISKDGEVKNKIYQRVFDPKLTKEIRVYLRNGKDSLKLDNKTSNIKLRIISGHDDKDFAINNVASKTLLFGKPNSGTFTGNDLNKLSTRFSTDTANTSYVAKDLYVRSTTLLNAGYNFDDGILLGLSYRVTIPGFRKSPYGSAHNFSFLRAFSSKAFSFHYKGERLKALGTGDFIIKADAYAPDNTQNFFGFGNDTYFDNKNEDIRHYRARFNIYQINPAIRYRRPKSTFTVGPSFEYYKFDIDDNEGRFITNSGLLHSADSSTISDDKIFGGISVNFTNNTRDNDLLPTLGSYVDFKLKAYKGLNKYSNDYAQFTADIAIYKNIDNEARLVLTDRFGGGITIGKPAFYQSLFIGGGGNLLGFRQYRFAGQHSFYNNLELRYKLGDFLSYILPGQIGLLAGYDVGRVWVPNEISKTWHQGVSAGIYFAPASLAVVRLVVGKSNEGWYPYISTGFRF